MTRAEFESVFQIGQVVISGGNRSQLQIDRIGDDWYSVIPLLSKNKVPARMGFKQLTAVIDGFNEIDPKRIQPTMQPVFRFRGLPGEYTTENYLYGFARAYLQATIQVGEELAEELHEPALYSEGSKKTIVVNAYERSHAAKTQCLRQHGRTCVVCKVDMGVIYGEIGRGFVHVHHLNPVAGRGGAYKLDAVKDLRPVCPNCHAMLHRENPPLSIEQLQKRMMIARSRTD